MPEPAPAVAQTEEPRPALRPTPATPPPGSVPGPVATLIKSPGAGEPLPTQVAERVARSIGVDVGAVRVHTDERSRAATALLNARAFAWGTHVFLGPRERPTDLPLLAHEIVHVVQQQGPGGPAVRLFSTTGPDPYEREAHAVSAAVVGDRRAAVAGRTGAPRVQGWLDWAKRGIAAVGRGISAAASAIAELGAAALNAALTFIKDHARSIPGYDVLAFIIGKDPITQETVDRNAVNLLKAVAGLIPGGAQLFENIQKAGVIQRAYEWFSTEVAKLGLTWAMIRGLFQQAWDALSVSDLISPSSAWEKIKRIFGPPVGKIVDFALAAGGKILELIFEGALALGGSAGQYVLSLFRRAQSVFKLIVSDPVKFVGNLVAAVKGGFQKFGSRILEHLKTAIFNWLFGALKGALTLPAKFDLMGIIDIVLQVLGLTYDRFREKLVKLIGEPAVAFVEKAFEFLKILVTQGLKAAWEKLLEFASGLVDTVIGAIRDWVAKSVVVAAITKLVTMFNPLGAIIQAIIGIYNTVMFFIEKAKEIAALVDAIITSVENIAKGNLGQAIDYVEKTLARLLSVLLGFLARFVGLGKVSDYVKDVIKKIQDTVDKAVDKAIAWVVDQVKGLLGKREKEGQAPEAHDARWTAATQAVERDVEAMRQKGIADGELDAKIPAWKSAHGFTDLKVEERGGAWEVWGAMSERKRVARADEPGSEQKPFELEWPKPPTAQYPSIFLGGPVGARRTQGFLEDHVGELDARGIPIREYKPHLPKRLPDEKGQLSGEEIGLAPKWRITLNKKVGPLSQATTPGGRKLNSILRDYGFRPKKEDMQADHAHEIQLGGEDEKENLWPLETSKNTRAGAKLRDAPITYPGSGRKAKISDLKKAAREYWFKITSFGA
jgi:hypothetical protein